MMSENQGVWIQMVPGVRRQTIAVGEKLMQMIVELKKGSILPVHQHVHEQVAAVVSGRIRFTIDGKPLDMKAGESVMLASNIPHGVEVLEDAVVLDTFSPVREDLLKQDAEARR